MKWETIEKIALIFVILSGVIGVPSFIMAGYGGSFLFQYFAEETWRGTPRWEHWKLVLYLEAICDVTLLISAVIWGIAEAKIKAKNKAKAWEKEDIEKSKKRGLPSCLLV